ncbi:hypothetical protein RSSM_05723 [Rhodopirellula sallentina SM41]|uniref:Uncharacterized protein n=1 Tax=Rhodopirellula sallentina SM41 TaxID=1263870 RepID=M5TUJ9_9BACT|nr:hypothetical protein RSSM_05723 [Rhodopirellula sallentina SM41]
MVARLDVRCGTIRWVFRCVSQTPSVLGLKGDCSLKNPVSGCGK